MSASGYGSHAIARDLAGASPWRARLVRALYPPMPTLNVIARADRARIAEAIFAPDATVLNIGSGARSGCGRWLWESAEARSATVIDIDIVANEDINLIANAECLPLADDAVDAIVLQAVLEHVTDPRTVLAEALRVLRTGGIIYLEVPFLQGFHADPHDYQRYTLPGLRRRLAAFEELESGVSVGPACTLVWVMRDLVSNIFTNRLLYAASRFLAGWLLAPLRYLDLALRATPAAERLANEFYFLGRKPGRAP